MNRLGMPKLERECDNRRCRKVNSPQAVEGQYVCLHCQKGTYQITTEEAAACTYSSLRIQERHHCDEERKRLAAKNDNSFISSFFLGEEKCRQNMAKAQYDEYERLGRHRQRMVMARKVEEEARIAPQKSEAASQSAHRAHEEADHQLRIQQEHEAELEKTVRDARMREKRNKQNTGVYSLVERRRAQMRHVESPPPARVHHSARAFTPSGSGSGSFHNVNPPTVRDHHQASKPSSSRSAPNVNATAPHHPLPPFPHVQLDEPPLRHRC